MKATSVRIVVSASLLLLLGGCAQPQPAATDDPVVTTPSDQPAPDAKPTAAPPTGDCFGEGMAYNDQAQFGGDVTWPEPLVDDEIGVEPSCWFDSLDTEADLFMAEWYGLDDAQYDLVNGPIESALQNAGFQLQDDTNGITTYSKPTGNEMEDLGFQITRTDGRYELAVTYGRG